MPFERFGRFEVDTYNIDMVQLYCDHGNGERRAYQIPYMSYEDAQDLIYALQRTLKRIDQERASRAQYRK